MKIVKIEIENFRSIEKRIYINCNDGVLAFIGPNNVGKSNILRAINLFFNQNIEPGLSFSPERDICKNRPVKSILITLVLQFDSKDAKKIKKYIDSNHSGDFKNYLIPITLRCYSTGRQQYQFTNIKGRKMAYPGLLDLIRSYVNCTYIPAIKDYKTIFNSEMMKKIVAAIFQGWGKGITVSTALGKNKDDFKKVLSSLQTILDNSGEYISEAIKTVVPRIKKFDFSLPYGNLEEFLGRLDFKITESGLLDRVMLEGQGSGVQSFTIFSMLRLLHELRPRNTYRKTEFLWLIEEPETFMHHDLQRNTFLKLQEYSKDGSIFITTHSPVFMDKQNFGNSYQVFNNGCTDIKPVTVKTIRDVIGGSLGVSFHDFFMFNRFNLFVEGESDKTLLLGLNNLFKAQGDNEGFDLQQLEIIVCGSASSIPHFFNIFHAFSRFASFMALFDKDDAGRKAYQNLLGRKYEKKDLFLIPDSPHIKDPAIEDIVDKNVWDNCLKNMQDKGLVKLVVGKTAGQEVIESYQYNPNDRVDVKKQFAKILLECASKDLTPFVRYQNLIHAISKRCRS